MSGKGTARVNNWNSQTRRDWRNDAACIGEDPELFFAGETDPNGKIKTTFQRRAAHRRLQQARAICATCPVLAPCGEWADTQSPYTLWGVWAGMDRNDRIDRHQGKQKNRAAQRSQKP